jgi:hypothetical protein
MTKPELSRQAAHVRVTRAVARAATGERGQISKGTEPTMPQLAEFHTLDRHRADSSEAREEGAECLLESELRHELDLAFNALGGAAFVLLHHRALADERLERAARRVYDLYAQLDRIRTVARVSLHEHDRSARPRLACL